MKTKLLSGGLILSAAILFPATAWTAGTGFFAGAGLGASANQDYDCQGCGAITSQDDSGTAGKMFAGYRFHPNFSLVGGYANLADTTAGGVAPVFSDKLEVDGWFLGAQGIVPISKAVEAFATLGAFNWTQKVTYSQTAPAWAGSGSFDGNDLMYGLGISYDLGKPDRVKLQGEWMRFKDVGTHDPNLGHMDDYDLYTINFIYQFFQ